MNNSLIQPENTLIVVALEDELPTHLVAGWNILYTGVGKVNAAIAATEAVIDWVINGSTPHNYGLGFNFHGENNSNLSMIDTESSYRIGSCPFRGRSAKNI